MKITVNVPKIGKSYGTCAFVAERLEQIELKVGVFKNVPSLFYRFKDSQLPDKWFWFCTVKTGGSSDENFMMNREVYGTFAIDAMDENFGQTESLFNYLTPKAKDIVKNFIEDVCIKFTEQLEEA